MLPEPQAFLIRGDDGVEYGPVDLAELRDWVQENRAGIGTQVRRDEYGSSWQPWQTYPELVALLAEVHATSPVPGLPGLVIAPVARRAVAFAVDLVLIIILLFTILIPLALIALPDWCVQSVVAASREPMFTPVLPDNADLVMRAIIDVLIALYFTFYHAAHGQTPAKALCRLRVVDENGRKPTLARSLWRSVVLVLSISLFFLPLLYVFFNPQRRAIHDIVAGTYVIEA